jgi:Flp pilus assembly protein TadG
MLMSRRSKRDERGAIAIMFALLIVLLASVAALGSDLGNAISRHTDTQNQADFAAYTASEQLTQSVNLGQTLTTTMIDTVRDALNANQPQTDNRSCWRNTPVDCVTSANLTDADLTNGDVRITSLGLQVTAPLARVNFGFAGVFGISGTSVNAKATVNVFSPGPRVLPMFAVTGCDYGRETLTDPANGQVTSTVPTLAFNSDTNPTKLTNLSVVLKDSTGTVVPSLGKNSLNNSMTISASKWNDVTKVGFFRGDDTTPSLVVPQPAFWLASDSTRTPLTTPYTDNNGGTLGLNIPDQVAQTETLWYVRAYDGTSWSAASEAQPIRVGQTLLECAAGSSGGNFGTLRLARSTGTPSDWVSKNLAYGLEDPLNLVVHQYAKDNTTDGTCDEQANPNFGAKEPQSGGTNSPLNPNANCVPTDPGLPANVATSGLITIDIGKGLLAGKATHPGCAPSGSPSGMRPVTLNNNPYSINNDTLSCFLTNGKTLADVESPSYSLADGPAFTADLLSSPRFAYVPVLKVRPDNGTKTYSIIDFRPAFITDEAPGSPATTDNGVTIEQNDVKTLKVFFFSINSLPHDGDVPLIDFLGVGQRVSHLVN